MSYSKRQLILGAMTEIGLSSYSFDMSADQIEQALHRLDSMIGSWKSRNINLGYPLPSDPEESDANSETNLPDHAWDAVITNLAVRLAPSYGKAVNPETLAMARETYNALLMQAATPQKITRDVLPSGAGNKKIDRPFIENDESGTA